MHTFSQDSHKNLDHYILLALLGNVLEMLYKIFFLNKTDIIAYI